jgi:hypothetical protein
VSSGGVIERNFAEQLDLTADAIFAAARRSNVPADSVIEVSPAVAQFSGRLRDWAEAVPSN